MNNRLISEDYLRHHGVKGMKWGVRSEALTRTTKSGNTISLSHQPPPKVVSFAAKYIPALSKSIEKTANYNLKDKSGSDIGTMTLYKKAPDEVNVVWVSTKDKVRGMGYGTAAMKAAIDVAKETGAKKVTLEVPGNSPDARHIYEKLGFKAVPGVETDPDDIWGGLTSMELELSNKIKHSENNTVSSDRILELIEKHLNEEETSNDQDLTHYGIPGMRWGKRKAPSISPTTGNPMTKKEQKEDRHYSKAKYASKRRNKAMTALNSDQKFQDGISKIYNDAVAKGETYREYSLRASVLAVNTLNSKYLKNNTDSNKEYQDHARAIYNSSTGETFVQIKTFKTNSDEFKHADSEESEEFEYVYLKVNEDCTLSEVEDGDEPEGIEDELKHYGIPGMRWGKRKGQVATSSSSKTTSKGTPTKRRVSNKELNAKLKRLKLEQEYERLAAVPKSTTVSKVESAAKLVGTVAALTTAAATIHRNIGFLVNTSGK